jgi:hypothetical protein
MGGFSLQWIRRTLPDETRMVLKRDLDLFRVHLHGRATLEKLQQLLDRGDRRSEITAPACGNRGCESLSIHACAVSYLRPRLRLLSLLLLSLLLLSLLLLSLLLPFEL